MKTLITKFLALTGVAIIMLSSCKKDEIRTVAPVTATGAALTLSTTTPALSKATLTSTAITITATEANYGYNAATTYAVQLAVKGTNFAAPTEISLTKDALTKTYNVQDFNNLLLGMKLPVNVAAQIEVRLKASLSATAGITYSSVSTITATPFPLTSWIYAVGAFQGWNATNPDSLISVLGNGVYKGILNFTAGNNEFLILPAKSFANKYATSENTTPSTKVTYNAGNNLKAPATAGQYLVTYDQNLGTITFEAANYYSVIGSAAPGVAWTTDTDLKYNNGTQAWEGVIAFTVGEFKVRKNHDWGTSYGVMKAPDGKTLVKDNSDNIPLTVAGNYKVTFATPYLKADGTIDDSKANYTLVKQ